jgi:hypothetical protein
VPLKYELASNKSGFIERITQGYDEIGNENKYT